MAASAGLSADELHEFFIVVNAEHEAAVRERERIASSLDDIRSGRLDTPADDEHDPEGSTMSFEWSRLAGAREDIETLMRTIDATLDRFSAGTYGMCVRCALPISKDRLAARPTAEYCIACARLTE
jgi:DnaK suppressor protein